MHGQGLKVHDRSKSSSLIAMALWSEGPRGRCTDDNFGISDKADFRSQGYRGIWSIHLSGIFGEEGRLACRGPSWHLEYSLERSLWQRISCRLFSQVCFFFPFHSPDSRSRNSEMRHLWNVFADKPRIHGLRESAVGKAFLE